MQFIKYNNKTINVSQIAYTTYSEAVPPKKKPAEEYGWPSDDDMGSQASFEIVFVGGVELNFMGKSAEPARQAVYAAMNVEGA